MLEVKMLRSHLTKIAALAGLLTLFSSCAASPLQSTEKTIVEKEYDRYVDYRDDLRKSVEAGKMSAQEANALEERAYERYLDFESRHQNRELIKDATGMIRDSVNKDK